MKSLQAADLHGLSRLAIRGVTETTGLVEHMHYTIARISAPIGRIPAGRIPTGRTRGITGLVYRSIHGVTGLVGGSLDLVFRQLSPEPAQAPASARRDKLVAILNGIIGDHLAATANPLAVPMRLRHHGRPLSPESGELTEVIEKPSNRLLITLHGLCMSDHCWTPQTGEAAIDIPTALASGTDHTRLDLHYNSGRSIAANGRELAALLDQLVAHWPVPVEQITLLGHSMGGLVSRSACHYGVQAGHRWPAQLRRMIFLGTPHHGSPLERAGHGLERVLGISPYSAPFNRLGRIRSAGIIDLRHGRIVDPDDIADSQTIRPSMPGHVDLYAIAAATAKRADTRIAHRFGDGLVPIDSALGRHPDPDRHLPIPLEHQHTLPATTHTGLLHHPQVLETLQRWARPEHS